MNPNNNKNFNDEALKINRMLKKENDKMFALLENLSQNANEDMPWENRTVHFSIALSDALDYINRE